MTAPDAKKEEEETSQNRVQTTETTWPKHSTKTHKKQHYQICQKINKKKEKTHTEKGQNQGMMFARPKHKKYKEPTTKKGRKQRKQHGENQQKKQQQQKPTSILPKTKTKRVKTTRKKHNTKVK